MLLLYMPPRRILDSGRFSHDCYCREMTSIAQIGAKIMPFTMLSSDCLVRNTWCRFCWVGWAPPQPHSQRQNKICTNQTSFKKKKACKWLCNLYKPSLFFLKKNCTLLWREIIENCRRKWLHIIVMKRKIVMFKRHFRWPREIMTTVETN